MSFSGLLLFFVLSLKFRLSVCHPQCLDFRPPFESTEKLFCSDYEDFGCCSLIRDRSLRSRYNSILKELRNEVTIDQKGCRSFLKSVLCQECSPYAAHIYDAEDDRVKRPFPGLCPDYCSDFYDRCRSLIPFITNDTGIAKAMVSREQFCENLTLTDVDYCYPDWVNKNVLNQSISRDTRTEEGCLCLEPFAPNHRLRNALSFRYSPDDTGRIFVSEQIGVVHIFYKNQTRLQEPFMDLSDVVLSSSSPGDERGFLNLAFHPRFAENGRFYVFFSINDEVRLRQKIRISEFRVREDDGNKVNRTSERVIVEVGQPYWNHNGGEVSYRS
ncbi:hypothetical protein LSH36_1g16003 [Paralvinella palmiformis]|uniref:Uncharacterized protein n=1 Tax=Paralvinella palmiformis TaxID=53620 RepID=A0AAD9KFI9_9ANNE|nr:hypothetical protein LSH36_1g16003 [Paralvinella palmiformis]